MGERIPGVSYYIFPGKLFYVILESLDGQFEITGLSMPGRVEPRRFRWHQGPPSHPHGSEYPHPAA